MRIKAALLGVIVASSATAAHAAEGDRGWSTAGALEKEWSVEITPYLWIIGMDADVTVGNRTVSPNVGFSDLVDAADFGGSLFAVLQYRRWMAYGQLDYLAISTSNLDDPPAAGELNTDAILTTLGAGYQLRGLARGSTIGAMLGARIAHFENDLTLNGIGDFSGSRTVVDPLLIVTPSIPLTSWLRLNPTASIGAFGDSDLTYELQPHLQFRITDTIAARVGYRRIYFDDDGDRAEVSGAMQGVILGLGVTL